ncbi:uncharacterized protein LOC115886123 isoform X2 [Sitophilus oryzae]|uniref:Uncharacterized protein LOC115886123 isoform X2 n=1 Tax=Sitophilus oryzae TaxID=7048 RepID=A0A6J2YCY5_SITOR|nr:uncharacterized protein LOC115886123 isoform X2 [Sitophilus oryzae]
MVNVYLFCLCWLTRKRDGSYCNICNTDIRSHRADLIRHSQTMKHKLQANKIGTNQMCLQKLGVTVSNDALKRKEIILATYIAAHSSIRSVDHLTDILNKFSKLQPGSASVSTESQDIFHLHKTKCAAIIQNVIAPALLKQLVNDVGDMYYSLLIDESTDVSTEKLLCLNIKYYSVKDNDIKLQFLSFISVIKTTAEDLYQAVSQFLLTNKFNVQKLLGIGTDGASNMCGINNSLYTQLKTKFGLEKLVLVKCICHSLNLCSSKAAEIFADDIDFLLKETYNWFKNSTLRISKYKDIFNLININTENKFSRLTQLSTTRWLSRYRAVDKILSQYLELQTFFDIHAEKERCHTAKILSDIYKNKTNKILLTFVKPILKQIYHLNIYFQASNVDFYQAFTDTNIIIWTFARQILKPQILENLGDSIENLKNSMAYDQNYLDIDQSDFGYFFDIEIKQCDLNIEEIIQIKNKCKEFLKVLILELIKRMPSHLDLFKKIKNISPKIILNPIRPKFNELPLDFMPQDKINDIETQYRQLLSTKWDEIFENTIPEDTLEFWKKVITLKNAGGILLFDDISKFVFTLLSLPTSNAAVERSFSILNVVKCKLRNKMMLNLLNSIMIIRSYLSVNNICCKIFEPNKEMVLRFNSSMYKPQAQEVNANDINDLCSELDTPDVEEVISLCDDILSH